MNYRFTAALAAGCAALVQFAPAQATTFAEYGATSSAPNIQWTQSPDFLSGSLATTGTGVSADTTFSFLSTSLAALTNLPALFTLSAAGSANDPAVTSGGYLVEPDISGTFSFIYEGLTPLTVGSNTYTTGANLLSGTFSGSSLSAPANGSTTALQDSILSGGTVVYTSAFTGFSPTGDKGLSLALTSVLPSYSAFADSSLNDFTAVSTGSFAADLSSGGGAGGAPEPAVWSLMVLGFGGVGAVLRTTKRRRTLLSA